MTLNAEQIDYFEFLVDKVKDSIATKGYYIFSPSTMNDKIVHAVLTRFEKIGYGIASLKFKNACSMKVIYNDDNFVDILRKIHEANGMVFDAK